MEVIDRELSWMNFNLRCLKKSVDENVPLLERLNFLGITESNLSEFISVRFSYVFGSFLSNKRIVDDLGEDNFEEKYTHLLNAIKVFKEHQYSVYETLMEELSDIKVTLIDDYEKIPKRFEKFCKEYFEQNIMPLLTPISYDSTKELSVMSDDELQFLIQLSDKDKSILCLMSVPKQIDRVIQLDDETFILAEEIITKYIRRLFIKKDVDGIVQFKTYRYISNIEVDEDEFILNKIKKYLNERDLSNNSVFMDVRVIKKSDKMVKSLYKLLDIPKNHIFTTKHPLLLRFLSSKFYDNYKYQYIAFKPQDVNEIIGDRGIMKFLQKSDLILHHPYETFQTIIDLIREAAEDPDVISIKQTLYRVSSNNSMLIKELCRAAQNGKKVTVMIELKARFSERQNLSIIETLKTSGVSIVYGFTNMKVHAKLLLIMKKTKKNNLRIFSHIGTGNYNEETAKLYTDISFLTSNDEIGVSLNKLFNMISGFSNPEGMKPIYYSPFNIRSKLYKNIDNEIKNAEEGKPAYVCIKVNSLCDLAMIEKIYSAAEAGVKFYIICRGICSIIANENIKIKSVIGRYLEHSRIYIFCNNKKEKVYISSADLLTRNLDHRVELMVEIEDEDCRKKIKDIFRITANDEFNSFVMDKNARYVKVKGFKNCHNMFMEISSESLKARKKK